MSIVAQKGQTTIIINGIPTHLPSAFSDGFSVEDKYIILLDENYARTNILALDQSGNEVWRVQDHGYKNIVTGYQLIYPIYSTNNLPTTTFTAFLIGTWYEVNANNGKIIMSYGDHQKTIYYNKPNTWLQKILKVFR